MGSHSTSQPASERLRECRRGLLAQGAALSPDARPSVRVQSRWSTLQPMARLAPIPGQTRILSMQPLLHASLRRLSCPTVPCPISFVFPSWFMSTHGFASEGPYMRNLPSLAVGRQREATGDSQMVVGWSGVCGRSRTNPASAHGLLLCPDGRSPTKPKRPSSLQATRRSLRNDPLR